MLLPNPTRFFPRSEGSINFFFTLFAIYTAPFLNLKVSEDLFEDVAQWKRPKNLFTSINFGYSADTNGLSDVDVSGHGSQPGVVPIFIIRGQLLGDVSLDNVNPFGQLDLAGPRISD